MGEAKWESKAIGIIRYTCDRDYATFILMRTKYMVDMEVEELTADQSLALAHSLDEAVKRWAENEPLIKAVDVEMIQG